MDRFRLRITSLILAGVLASVVVVMASAAILWTVFDKQRDAVALARFTTEVAMAAFQLTALTQDYLLYREPRAKTQWMNRHESLGKLLYQPRFDREQTAQSLVVLRRNHAVARRLFLQIEPVPRDVIGGQEPVSVATREKRLVDLILTVSEAMVSEASLMSLSSRREMETFSGQTRIFFIAVTVIFSALLIGLLLVLVRRIAVPIRQLKAGINVFAGGDLQHRLGATHEDEIGEIATAFNEMAENLHETMISRDELESRVAERTAQLVAMQETLLRKERLAAMGQLTGTVAHEIRNPLGVIAASHKTIERKIAAADPLLDRALSRMGRGIERCQKIITELLDFARAKGLQLETRPFDPWLAEILGELAFPDGLSVKTNLGTQGAALAFDGDELRRAVINVVDNAVQGMGYENGASRPETAGELTITTGVKGGRLEIEIADNGPGIPEHLRAKVLEPLFSTKSFGTGLGLPTVKKIMDEHGGGLKLESGKQSGTRVFLFLPLSDPSRTTAV